MTLPIKAPTRATFLVASAAVAALMWTIAAPAFQLLPPSPMSAHPPARTAANEIPEAAEFSSSAGTPAFAALVLVLGTGAAALRHAGPRRAAKVVRKVRVAMRQSTTTKEGQAGSMSMAVPFWGVPPTLTNDPLNRDFPGDVGFDPLGFSAECDNSAYISEVFRNHDLDFEKLRWYREAELMHGRVAMLASLNILVRQTALTGYLPDQLLEEDAVGQFASSMALLEAYRGWRLLFNQDQIAGDLGLGGGYMEGSKDLDELVDKQYKELQNGRLAMVAITGMFAQYWFTGRWVGVDFQELFNLQDQMASLVLPGDDMTAQVVLSCMAVGLAADGIRRLSMPKETELKRSAIATKAINPLQLQVGVQNPEVALPAGVVAGQVPQHIAISEEQVVRFEEDGVIMIKGAMKPWVDFLRAITEHQIDHPHIWSLVGRASGLYDYIQRNMWMTNDGFRDFLYYSPLGSVLAQLGRTEEIRVSTDMLLVNPNKGFGWHQDNQNGPIDFPDALRWWVAMDRCGEADYGAPEYLLGSHRNGSVNGEAVFVNVEDGDLPRYKRSTKFVPDPGDLIIWDARCIHRIVAPPDQLWQEGTQRRALGGTAAKGGAIYYNKGGASAISDLAGHEQQNGELLGGPYFPRIYPTRVPEEEAVRNRGEIEGRSPAKIVKLGITLAQNASKYMSFTKVVGRKGS